MGLMNLTGKARKHGLHIVIGIYGRQKRFHFFHVSRAQAGGVDRVFSLVAQLGRQHGKAVGGQGAAD